jgi:hypothetical protein
MLLALVFCFSGCSNETETVIGGIEDNSSTQLSMSYDEFTGYRQRIIHVPENMQVVVGVDIVTDSGSIKAYIARDNNIDNSAYKGNEIKTSTFTVTLQEAGDYTLRVDAKKHRGGFTISWDN